MKISEAIVDPKATLETLIDRAIPAQAGILHRAVTFMPDHGIYINSYFDLAGVEETLTTGV